MPSIAPRRECPTCGREIAVVSGHFARHDPPRRPRGPGPLVSCLGSHTAPPSTFLAPDRCGTVSVFELLARPLVQEAVRARLIQEPLFPHTFSAVL